MHIPLKRYCSSSSPAISTASEDSQTSMKPTNSACSCEKLDRLEDMIGDHTFLPYTEAEVEILVRVIRRLVSDRYPRFGGATWVFLRSPVKLDIINWVDSLPFT